MSKISNVYDALVLNLDAILTGVAGYTRIPDPENPEDNPKQFLNKAWGVYYSGATPSETDYNKFSNDHTFTVVLSRQLVTKDSATLQKDNVTKELLEDAYTVQKSFYDYSQLDIPEDIAKIENGEISDIQDVDSGKNAKYKFVTVNFIITIWEDF